MQSFSYKIENDNGAIWSVIIDDSSKIEYLRHFYNSKHEVFKSEKEAEDHALSVIENFKNNYSKPCCGK